MLPVAAGVKLPRSLPCSLSRLGIQDESGPVCRPLCVKLWQIWCNRLSSHQMLIFRILANSGSAGSSRPQPDLPLRRAFPGALDCRQAAGALCLA